MTISMQTVISNMRALKGKVTYSQLGSRTGEDGTADCSGTVYASLNKAGANLPLGNTDSLFTDLPKIDFQKTDKPYKYGDIFIFGIQGQSSGDNGHTGIFVSGTDIIHCNAAANGISIDNFEKVWKYDYEPPYSVFRLKTSDPEPTKPTKDADKQENTSANMDNSGELEEYSYIGAQLCVKGWHFASVAGERDPGGGGTPVPSPTPVPVIQDDFLKMNVNSNFDCDEKKFLAGAKQSARVQAWLGSDDANIKKVAEIVRKNGMSPELFFAYDIQEQGTSLGWLNHTYYTGDPYTDADSVSKWAVAQANTTGAVQLAWIDLMNPYYETPKDKQAKGQAFANALPKGAIGRMYLSGTAAATWAAFDPEALKKEVNKVQDYGNPLTGCMQLLSAWGSSAKSKSVKADKKINAKEYLEVYDATNDKKLGSAEIGLHRRDDIKERFDDVEGVEWSGIDVCVWAEYSDPFYVKFVREDDKGNRFELCLQALFFPHSSARKNIGHDYSCDCGFTIECTDKKGKTQYVNDMLSGISWTIEANEVPSCSFVIPIHEAEKFDGHMDVRVIVFGKMFDGIVKQIDLDDENYTATIQLDHKIAEWEYRQIPNNYTVKNKTVPSVFCQSPFLYSTDWYVDCDGTAQKQKINYAFSRQSHLEALDKALELTDSLWWRIGTRFTRYLEIGAFGAKKQYILSTKGRTKLHIPIIGEVKVTKAFDGVFNVATIYGEKSDSSQASLTLREAFLAQQQQKHDITEGFPIVIFNPTTNREQKNYYTNITKIASNNSLEYAVLDEFGINLEQGKLIEKTISMNDLAPFEENGKEISDEERVKQARIAYDVAVRRLKTARRCEEITVDVGVLPADINVLDKIYFDYSGIVQLFDGCSRYCRKFYEASADFYITKIETIFDENLNETNKLTLRKELKRDDTNY